MFWKVQTWISSEKRFLPKLNSRLSYLHDLLNIALKPTVSFILGTEVQGKGQEITERDLEEFLARCALNFFFSFSIWPRNVTDTRCTSLTRIVVGTVCLVWQAEIFHSLLAFRRIPRISMNFGNLTQEFGLNSSEVPWGFNGYRINSLLHSDGQFTFSAWYAALGCALHLCIQFTCEWKNCLES